MAGHVTRLQDIGLTKTEDFATVHRLWPRIVELNNPHESAYCRKASCFLANEAVQTRELAEMANDYRVRVLIAKYSVIPDDTVFNGAYHNTCDDLGRFASCDLPVFPASHRADFETASARRSYMVDTECLGERCRRFARHLAGC